MNILTIDTATDFEFISVTTEHGTFEYSENVKMTHSITLFDNINRVLENASITIKDINLIGVGIGPGSFTGVRIAVSTARMIAQILGVPLVGITTQDIFSSSINKPAGAKILIAFDAKKSRVFASLYKADNEFPPEQIIPVGDYKIEYLLEHITGGETLLCAGDGCNKYRETIESIASSAGFNFRILENFIPSGSITSELTLLKYRNSPELYRFYGSTIPFYARKSDAEVAKDEKNRVGL